MLNYYHQIKGIMNIHLNKDFAILINYRYIKPKQYLVCMKEGLSSLHLLPFFTLSTTR